MTKRVSVTIGIPFLNARATLADAVRSVFAQTYQDWELLLVNDGSTDGSPAIAQSIADPRVRSISDGVKRGLVHRLNQIAGLAQGKYLARMDADDLMHPRRIERQMQYLEANPSVDVIDTATYTVDDDLTPLGIRGEHALETAPEAVLRNGLFIHPTVMGRADWFRANPYDPAYVRAEDRELWCRTASTGRFARLREPLLFYREGLAGNLRNYLKSAATVRRILCHYGPPQIGSWGTSLLLGRSYASSIIYYLFTIAAQQDRLIRKRNRPLNKAEECAARTTLTEVLRVGVPGLCAEPACEGSSVPW